MISSVLVVLIVGAVVAVITRAVLDDGQPATVDRDADLGEAHRQAAGQPGAGVDVVAAPRARAQIAGLVAAGRAAERAVPWWRPVRSTVLLALSIVLLGILAAAVVGGIVLVGITLLEETLA